MSDLQVAFKGAWCKIGHDRICFLKAFTWSQRKIPRFIDVNVFHGKLFLSRDFEGVKQFNANILSLTTKWITALIMLKKWFLKKWKANFAFKSRFLLFFIHESEGFEIFPWGCCLCSRVLIIFKTPGFCCFLFISTEFTCFG